MLRTIVLEVDGEDWDAIQWCIVKQIRRVHSDMPVDMVLPEPENSFNVGNIPGRSIGEICRQWDDLTPDPGGGSGGDR